MRGYRLTGFVRAGDLPHERTTRNLVEWQHIEFFPLKKWGFFQVFYWLKHKRYLSSVYSNKSLAKPIMLISDCRSPLDVGIGCSYFNFIPFSIYHDKFTGPPGHVRLKSWRRSKMLYYFDGGFKRTRQRPLWEGRSSRRPLSSFKCVTRTTQGGGIYIYFHWRS